MGVFETSIAKANHFIWWNRENSTQLSVTAQVQCLYWKVASMFDNLNPQMWNFVLYPSLDILTTEPCQTEKSPKAAEAGCGGWLVLRQWSKNPGEKKPCICIILYNMCIIYIYCRILILNILNNAGVWYDPENNEDEKKDDVRYTMIYNQISRI